MSHFAWLRVLPAAPTVANANDPDLGRVTLDLPNFVQHDVGLPGLDGARGLRRFRERFPDLFMLVLPVHTNDPRAIEAMCSAACEYLLRKTPEAPQALINPFPEIGPHEQAVDRLTPHEVRMLKLLVDGHSYKTAATALGVSQHTVSFHLRSVYEKLQVHSKSEAVSKALRNWLV
jgi:DNA-binding NarL/FixJ family response regulator